MLDDILSAQQIEVINALSNGANMTTAAGQAGVHRNTIANWRRNVLPFQHALAHVQYEKAMLVREKTGDLVDLAFKGIQDILTDPKVPASVRLKAALAIIHAASTAPEPGHQVTLEIGKAQAPQGAEPESESVAPQPVAHTPAPQTHNDAQTSSAVPLAHVHKTAQTIRQENLKVGRNEPCPCGSNLKFKRCCLNSVHQTRSGRVTETNSQRHYNRAIDL